MDQPVTVKIEIHLVKHGGNSVRLKQGPAPKPVLKPRPPENVPRIVRLLALAHHFQKLLDDGWVSDYADIARLAGVTRARVSQIMDLLLLAPSIQEAILLDYRALPPEMLGAERAVRELVRLPAWREQEKRFRRMHSWI